MLAVRCIELREREESSMLRGRKHAPNVVVVPVGHRHEALDESPGQLFPSSRVVAQSQQDAARSAAFTSTGRCRAATTG